ncbi:MAG: magnesium/cobalt transporter CorA [Bacillota bacterium]
MAVKVLYRGADPSICHNLGSAQRRIAQCLSAGIPVWVDMEAPNGEEVSLLADVFHFHPLAIEDCLSGLQRPKIDEYPGHLFLVVHSVSVETESGLYRPAEFNIFIAREFIVTFHAEENRSLNRLREEYCKTAVWKDRSTGFLLQAVLGTLLDDFFPVIDDMGDELDSIERRIFVKPDQDLLALSFRLRRSIFLVRKSLSPERDVLIGLLRRECPFMAPEDRAYFMDVYDRILRLFDFAENMHELLSNAMDSYLSSISNRTNEVMKVLTIITTIMMPLTLIAGIYGMNFRYMPEIGWRYGYPMALGSMALVTGIMLRYFRKKGWF